MTNKRRLEQHNKRLESCVNKVDKLPDIESGKRDPILQSKIVTTNGKVVADIGFDGLSEVTVNVPQPSGSTTLTTNGTHNVKDFEEAIVDVPDPPLQEKSVSVNSYVAPDDGFYGLSGVTVNVPIPDGYVHPEGLLEVTENGDYDVTMYTDLKVNVVKELEIYYGDHMMLKEED